MSPLTRRYHLPSALRRSPLRLDPDAARTLLADGALLIDVRRQDDPATPPEGAVRIPPDQIPEHLGQFSREVSIVLACT